MKLPITLALLTGLTTLFAAASGSNPSSATDTLAAPALQAGSSAPAAPSSPMLEQFRSQDNVHGLQLVGSQGVAGRLLELLPFTPPAAYAAHLQGQTNPVRVVLRKELGPLVRDLPFSHTGNSWSLALPKHGFSSIPGTRYSVLAWGAGPGLGDSDWAVFNYTVEL